RENGRATAVTTSAGETIAADVFGIGLGLTINTELAVGTGIQTRTGFVTDERLFTGVDGVYAAGDCAEFYDPGAQMHYRMGTWNSAGAHGKLAAINMSGGAAAYDTIPEYSSLVFRGQTITQFGLSPEYRDDLECDTHVDNERGWYRALYFLEGRLVGGVMIGKGNRAGKRRYLDAIRTRATFERAERRELLVWTSE
ncbi:MAG: FAD-dependent oxidoreductase, partial [Vulcanimicrobiaceae bacterium]